MTTLESNDIARLDEKAAAKIASAVDNYKTLVQDASHATSREKSMGIIEALMTYPKAVLFAVGISLAIVMEGYDTMLLGNFYAQPAFQKKFGVCNGKGECQLTSAWQTGLANGTQIGSMAGLLCVGWLSDNVGYRKTMMGSLVLMASFIFIPFFAQNKVTLLFGQLLQGIPWGIYQSLTIAYAADICPIALRYLLTTYVNLCWVFGQLIAAGVLRSCVNKTDHWAWRLPYALQWMWIPICFTFCYLAPESPYFLVRKGRLIEAEKAVLRLQSSVGTAQDAKKTVAMMKHTNELEIAVTDGVSYLDLFKGSALRRTEIAMMSWSSQQWCGSNLMGFSTYFLIQSGVPTERAFDLNIGNSGIGAIGTISSWFTMQYLGRRQLYLIGEVLMFLDLLAIGIVAAVGGSGYIIGGLLLLLTCLYDASVGPCCYTLVAEIPSTRLRAKSNALSRLFYNCSALILNTLGPKMLNPGDWNLGGKAAFVWMGTDALMILWAWFRLPETKDRSTSELDVLFENKVPARKFKHTKVDQFGQENDVNSSNNGGEEDEKKKLQDDSNVAIHTLSS